MGTSLSFFGGDYRPVEKINWFEAMNYCRLIAKRLPTEWEWEWTARSGSTTKFYWVKEILKLIAGLTKIQVKKLIR